MGKMVAKAATATGLELTEGDLQKINQLALRQLKAEEVFSFRVTMADNEIDRDGEAFPLASLEKLAKLFEGKPVIRNHDPKAQNQVARIYRTEVVTEERKSKTGEEYARLVAYCYTPRQGKEWLITDIEAGIVKEVSVSCKVGKCVCSICGKDWTQGCGHLSGKTYEGKRCHWTLEQPMDAYELSFVPIPAQPAAGAIKNHVPQEESEESLEMEPEIRGMMDRITRKLLKMEEIG